MRAHPVSRVESDLDYYQRRADEEFAHAQRSSDPQISARHRELAELLLARSLQFANAPSPPVAASEK